MYIYVYFCMYILNIQSNLNAPEKVKIIMIFFCVLQKHPSSVTSKDD